MIIFMFPYHQEISLIERNKANISVQNFLQLQVQSKFAKVIEFAVCLSDNLFLTKKIPVQLAYHLEA